MNEVFEKLKKKITLSNGELKQFIGYIIAETRKSLGDDMINKCDACEGLIGRFLDLYDLNYYACSTNKVISSQVVGHSFIVLNYNDNLYLLDPTYIQFKYINTKDIYINSSRATSFSPYYYASILNKELITNFIELGYSELNTDFAYVYGNSFYFTMCGISEKTNLKALDGKVYINAFKKGNDELKKYNYEEIGILK